MRDDASLHSLEALLFIVVVLLGFTIATTASVHRTHADETALLAQTQAKDAVMLLASFPASGHASLLHAYLAEAYAGDPSRLERHLDRILPNGAGWALTLDNGVAVKDLARRGYPTGSVATFDILVEGAWSHGTTSLVAACVPATDGADPLRVRPLVWRNSHLVDAEGDVLVGGVARAGASGALEAVAVAPALPGATDGHPVPYDLTSVEAHADSVAAQAGLPPVPYTTALASGGTGPSYSVHPACDVAAAYAYLDAAPRVDVVTPRVAPGETVTLSYALQDLPLPSGAGAASVQVRVLGPLSGQVVFDEALPALDGSWTWAVPKDALYGSYLVQVRLLYEADGVPQAIEEVARVDVTRPGIERPVLPLYRVGLSVWFEGL